MNRFGFISLILLLITIAIIAILYTLSNPFKSYSQKSGIDSITAPQRIQETQDVVDEFQQKSIERQTIEIK